MASPILVRVDPMNDQTGPAFPALCLRIRDFMREHFPEGDPDIMTRQVLGRVAVGDPAVFLLAMVDLDKGTIVGHLLCTLEQVGDKKWVYGWQAQVNPGLGDALERAFAASDAWAAPLGATTFAMTTPRAEKGWEKKYRFTSVRHVMSRPIPFKKEDDA